MAVVRGTSGNRKHARDRRVKTRVQVRPSCPLITYMRRRCPHCRQLLGKDALRAHAKLPAIEFGNAGSTGSSSDDDDSIHNSIEVQAAGLAPKALDSPTSQHNVDDEAGDVESLFLTGDGSDLGDNDTIHGTRLDKSDSNNGSFTRPENPDRDSADDGDAEHEEYAATVGMGDDELWGSDDGEHSESDDDDTAENLHQHAAFDAIAEEMADILSNKELLNLIDREREMMKDIEFGESHDLRFNPLRLMAWNLTDNDLEDEDLRKIKMHLLYFEENLSTHALERFRELFPELGLDSLKVNQRRVALLSRLLPVKHDMCPNSCIAYTGKYIDAAECFRCKTPRYHPDGKPRMHYFTLPIILRLVVQFRNASRARDLYALSDGSEAAYPKSSLFHGALVRELRGRKIFVDGETLRRTYFADRRDLCIALSTDGFTLFKRKKSDMWPICAIIHNLPDDIQTKQENVMLLAFIPGPNAPFDFDSFLSPIIDEFATLARGVDAFDASIGKFFKLHAFPVLVFGDMMAICKAMGYKGPAGEHGC